MNIQTDTLAIVLLAVIVILAAVAALSIINNIKLSKIMKNSKLGNLDETIVKYYNSVSKLTDDVKAQTEYLKSIEETFKMCSQKVGFLRYNAFEDAGRPLSYSLAVLNGHDDGYVLTGIFGREICSTYLKPVKNGKSEIALSKEELIAIKSAMESVNKQSL